MAKKKQKRSSEAATTAIATATSCCTHTHRGRQHLSSIRDALVYAKRLFGGAATAEA